MRHLHQLCLRVRSLFARNRVELDLRDEFAFHLDQLIEENLSRGLPPTEARAAALRTIGGISQFQEECRDMRRVNYIETAVADIRHAIRGFRKQPGFTFIAILTLALGIGAGTALFSLVNTLLLQPLPVAQPERLAMLWERDMSGRRKVGTPAPANFADWRARNHTFQDIAAAGWLTFNITGRGEPERLTGLRVTANYFSVLGVKPAIGRLLTPADDSLQSGHVAVISYGLWQRRFGSDPNLIGRNINLNGDPYTIVGVSPAGFQFPANGADLWVAPGFTPRDLQQRTNHLLYVTGRLKPLVSLQQASADLETIASRLQAEYPESNKNIGVAIVPLREYYTGDVRRGLNLLLAAVGVLLAIVCANLAHLFLARGASRHREVALRAALGAGRARVIRQLLTECVVLALLAAGLGALVSTAAFRFLARLIPNTFPDGTTLHLDLTVFAFTAGLALLTALLFGIAPAIQASRLDLNEMLKRGSAVAPTAFSRLQEGVVVAEVALTVLLLVAGGLLLQSYVHIRNVNTGFRAENVLTLETILPPSKYADLARRSRFYSDVIEQTATLPGVISAGYISFPPLTMKGGSSCFWIEGRPRRPGEASCAFNRVATNNYLRTIGVPVLRGRLFDLRDGAESPRVMLINQTMAHTDWPGQDPIGAHIRFGDGRPNQPVYTVIGIVGDVSEDGLDEAPKPEMYFSTSQPNPGGSFFWAHTLVVRAVADPAVLAASIRRLMSSIDPDQPVSGVRTLNDVLNTEVSGRQTQTAIVAALAICALLLAFVGLYGVLSYSVAQRRTEIGIRTALGAQRTQLVRDVVSQSLRWTALGVIFGLAGAFVLTRIFTSLLFRVSPSDPLTFAGVSLVTFAVAVLATFVPARRAATVDPVISLRCD